MTSHDLMLTYFEYLICYIKLLNTYITEVFTDNISFLDLMLSTQKFKHIKNPITPTRNRNIKIDAGNKCRITKYW